MPAEGGYPLKTAANLSQRPKPAAMALFPLIHNLLWGNTLTRSKYPRSRNKCTRSRSKYSPKPKQVSPETTAGIPGGDELYLAAGERSVTRGRQHVHVSSPKGANSIREREGEWKVLSIVRCPLSVVHCFRRSPPSGTHTQVGLPIRGLRSLRSLTRG